MCYAFKQRSYWYIYDFRLDIMFFPFVTIPCVHPSLWIDIIMIFIYLEYYTLERNYISSWYPFFHVHLVFLMLFLWWLRESFCLECVSSIIASWCTLVWWRLFSSCLSLRGFCHLNWYPSSWWGFHLLSSPWVVTSIGSLLRISKLVNPFASCVWEW